MKLTIDISDDLYNGIVKNEYGLYNGKFFDMIRGGTPLPKGHGRIGDLDAVMNDICTSIDTMTNIGITVDGEYLWAKLNDAIYDAPTIIEADNEE